MNKFGERLKELRLESGLSQEGLALLVGCSHSAIGHWESKKRMPSLDMTIKFAKFFKVSLGYMAGVEY